jgi:hypothetical protein
VAVVGMVAAAVGPVVIAVVVVEQGTSSFIYHASVTRTKPMSLFLMISLEVQVFNIKVYEMVRVVFNLGRNDLSHTTEYHHSTSAHHLTGRRKHQTSFTLSTV